MLCDVAPAIHVYQEKRVAWLSISMHACDPVPIVKGLRLALQPLELRCHLYGCCLKLYSNKYCLLTESEVITGKSQTKALMY